MKRSLGLSRSKGPKVPAKRQTDKLDSSESLSLPNCLEVDSGLSSAEEDKSQSGDGSSGTFKVQLFRQSPSTSSSSMVSGAHQPKSASDSAPFGSVDQSLESTFSTSAPRTTLVSSVPSVCLPSTSSAAVSASSSSSSPSKHAPIQFPLKRPANDAKPTTSKKQKSKGASQNIPLITSFFKKRSETPSTASHTRHSTDSDSSGTDEEDVEGSDESQPDLGPSTSNQNTRQPKLPVKGSKDYDRCLENWNIFKEVEELIATRPDLTQQQRQEIVASRRKNCKWGAINANYRKTLIRIEMSGKAITSNHPLNNELFQMLSILKSEVEKFSKAKVAAANGKDEETAGSSKTNTRKYAINRFKKGSHDYNRILSSWETYKEAEALRTSQPDLEGNKDRCQFLATSKNVPFSTIYNKFDFVQRRLNLVNQYVSVNHPFDEELIQILAIPHRQLTKHQKSSSFSDLQNDDEKVEAVKRTLNQAFDFNVPPNEHFLFAAKSLNTTEREVRMSFVKSKVSGCREMRVTSTTALRAIRQESIKILANLHISQLCELTAREKAILSHFELAAEPYSIKCTLQHNKDYGTIGFNLYCRQMLLQQANTHFELFHTDYYKNFETSASLLPVRPDVHRLYSKLVEALNHHTFVSNLVILSNITRLPDSTVAAEKVFIDDDHHTFEFPATASGIDAKDRWIFSFFRLSELRDHFKCRLWHQKESIKIVSSEVYFKDGLLIEKHLYNHLNNYHGIAKDFGAANDSYTDAPSGQTISLKSMPIETFNLISRLLNTDEIPFQNDCSSSIDADGNIYPLENSHTNASELSSFVKELSEDEFKVLALFKPSKCITEIHCRLNHKIRCDTVNCSRGTTMSKNIVLFALKRHLTAVHRMTIACRENGTEVINGKSKISLTRMPLDTIAWLFNVAHGKVDKSNLKENSSITPLATHSFLVENEDEDELKSDPDPWVEIATIKCMPSDYYNIANSSEELSKGLKLSQKIRNAIVGLDRSTNASNARNYLVFMKAVTSSVHDFIDAILYGGFTDGKLADSRIRTYVKDVQLLIDGKQTLDQFKEDKNKEMLGSMVACWRAGSESYAHYLTENLWQTQNEALFTERSVIAALKYLPINCNKNHGSTTSYSEVLTKHGITEQLICKAGIAELVLFYQKHQLDCRLVTPVYIASNHITRTPSPTPKYLLSSGVLETVEIPPYSLICPPLPIDLHKHYAVHLFMALFTLPVKDTFWYLNRANSYKHINLLDESHRNEVTESINSVLSYLSFDFHQCLQWAQQLWHTIFVANVEAANRELGNSASRHPASKQTHKHNVDFISVSALLLTKVIGLKDENGDEYTIKSFELPTIEFLENPGTYQVGEVPVYNKLQLFTDLAHIDFPSLDNFIKPGDKPQHTVTALDPFPDDVLFNKFFLSTISLKHFNFSGTFPNHFNRIPQFKILPFLWASRFHQII